MQFSLETHAQAVRDRQQALRADADAHRLVVRTPGLRLGRRLRCLAVRLRIPVAAPCGCSRRPVPVR
jgi:hypothetical protein